MTEDAIYLIDLFHLQLGSIQWELLGKSILPERFNSYSFSAWAIQETLTAVKSYEGLVTVDVIKDILDVQRDMYGRYYDGKETQLRFKYAYDTIIYLIKLSGKC